MDKNQSDTIAKKIYFITGSRIKQLRTEKHISQKSFAFKLGLTRTSISNIEHGRQKILLDTLWRIADILKVDIVELIPKSDEVDSAFEGIFPRDTSKKEKDWIIAEFIEEKV